MPLRTIFFACALVTLPAYALETVTAHPAASLQGVESSAISTQTDAVSVASEGSDDAPVGSYGLAIATLALVGFMSRR